MVLVTYKISFLGTPLPPLLQDQDQDQEGLVLYSMHHVPRYILDFTTNHQPNSHNFRRRDHMIKSLPCLDLEHMNCKTDRILLICSTLPCK